MSAVGLVIGDPSAPTTGDAALKTRLEGLGHAVTYIDDDASVPSGYDAFVLSETCLDTTLAAKYNLIAVPCVVLEHNVWDDMRLAANIGISVASAATYSLSAHEIVTSLSNPLTVLSSAQTQRGVLASALPAGATTFARPAGDITRGSGWAVEAGGTLTAGTSPARRVALFLPDSWVTLLTGDGWTLFDRVVGWVLNITVPRASEVTTWIDGFGRATPLDVDWEATGRFMPPVAHEEDGVPGQPGGRHRASRHDIREFTIKVVMSAADEGALRQTVRAMVAAMNPAKSDNPGAIRVAAPDGVVREIPCYYSGGLDLSEQPEMSGPQVQMAAVTFRSYDPYWRDVSDQTAGPFTVAVTSTFFPILPLRLTSSQIAVDTTIQNAGDVDTWPVWTITGPGGVIVLRNVTTGDALTFGTTTLGYGESISIDTRPGYKTVTKNNGTNLFPDLSLTSELWPLVPGGNAVRLEMSGIDAAFSSLAVNYRQRYLTP